MTSGPATTSSPMLSNSSSRASPIAASTNFENLLGHNIRLTLGHTSSVTSVQEKDLRIVYGKLWAYDPSIGVVGLETVPAPLEPFLATAPANAAASLLASRNRSSSGAVATQPATGFKIVKISEVKKVEFIVEPDSASLSHDRQVPLTSLHPVSLKAAQVREANSVRHSLTKASRMGGKDVTEMGQLVFDALSKTLPCRWHGPHIIVLEEVVISGPGYDPASTNVPNFTQEQLRSYIDGTQKGSAPDGAQAKANSWNRVVKVLEGERRKIMSTQAFSGQV